MQIRLNKRGPFIWFLGDPRQLICSLNKSSPKATIDFDALTSDQQLKVLNSIQKGQISSDEDYQDLYSKWSASSCVEQKQESAKNPQIQMQLEAQQRIQERRAILQAKRDKEQKKKEELCANLVKRSFNAVRHALKDEEDINFLKLVLQTERVHRNRKSVNRYLKEKIKREAVSKQERIALRVEKAMKTQLAKKAAGETIHMRVIESEQETIVLTPEDLIAAANE